METFVVCQPSKILADLRSVPNHRFIMQILRKKHLSVGFLRRGLGDVRQLGSKSGIYSFVTAPRRFSLKFQTETRSPVTAPAEGRT